MAITNKAAMCICVLVFVWVSGFIYLVHVYPFHSTPSSGRMSGSYDSV